MPALRLRAKLVFAITGMVVAIVATLAALYIFEVVHQHIQDAFTTSSFIGNEIYAVSREALQTDLGSYRINLNNPKEVATAEEEILQTDSDLNALLDSVQGDTQTIYDAAIVDASGRALLHTNPDLLGKTLAPREDFSVLAHAGIGQQMKILYGPSRAYDFRMPLVRGDQPFGEVRIGVSTLFLQSTIRDQMRGALLLSGGAVLFSLILAAGLSNFALRPLAAISRQLDLISAGQVWSPENPVRRTDEYGVVTSKIERLGRQMRDVKEVFSALKENLDQMMANLQDGVMLFTSDFRAVLVSASAERFIGKPRGAMLGCRPAEIFSGDSRLGRAILQAMETHQPVGQEEIENEHGRHIQVSLDFIEERGERIGALLTLRDAESVHRIEDEIELSRRLAAIGRLTSGVAHEVKNPINAIVVHLEVLRQKLKEIDPDTRRHMDVIGSEIQRLDRVVQTLVDFTRPVDLRLSVMDLRRMVEDVVMLASPAAEQHKVRIERQAGKDPLAVRMDADLVKQALLNIVLNGVQAMPEGGTLRVAIRREGDGALITVRDQGAGIPEDIRDKVFNLYFTTKKGGSGIGLAMAYRVVQLHHGSVEFTSVAGHGTTFYLRFPLAESAAGSEPSRVASEDSVSKA
ncbi:MAG TPA: ATP-binding protein [Candidatus Angelobacter sp.]